MEQDILVEGFKNSEAMHGLKYKYFVGDGDSSVYAGLVQNVSYGRSIHKIVFSNHCVKNYTSALHKLSSDKNFPTEARKILKSSIPRFTVAARSAIRHCANSGDKVEDLIKDLSNGPYHVFGEHSNCSKYFCSQESSNCYIESLKDSKIFDQVESLVNRLVAKAPRLIADKTSNQAEFYMSLLAKYNAGKRINFTQRGSFKRRCTVAGMRFQKGHTWEISPFKKLTGRSPGMVHKKLIKKRVRQHVTITRCKLEYSETDKPVKRHKVFTPADEDYGPDSEEPEDLNNVQRKCEEFLKTLSVTAESRDHIVQQTIGQSDCELWHEARRIRLAASNFGPVCRRKETTSCSSLVKQLLYKPPVTTAAIEYGRSNECVAIKRFKKKKLVCLLKNVVYLLTWHTGF
ncbi:uncharacterized protein LOC134535725 isoform X2 [Bacillus rossius redtenbacheri]